MKFKNKKELCKLWPFPSRSPIDGWTCDGKGGSWVVLCWEEHGSDGTPWEGMLRVSIGKYPKPGAGAIDLHVNWSKIQEIKEQLFPDRLAMEIYPPEEQVVDVANLRWLWILPEGCKLPFSLSGQSNTVGV